MLKKVCQHISETKKLKPVTNTGLILALHNNSSISTCRKKLIHYFKPHIQFHTLKSENKKI